ncbi:MAG: hypothetical protein ACI4JF_01225 [Oscillospiraceae bacterium]
MNEKINGLWVLRSAEPLPNELEKMKKIYIIIIIGCVIGLLFSQTILTISGMALMLFFMFDYMWTYAKLASLRQQDFKFAAGITYDDIFEKLHPALISKYGPSMQIERCMVGSENIVNVTYDNIIYQIFLYNNSIFRIRWGKSLGRAMAPSSHYKDYKKAIIGMGIIGYELQSIFNINR